MKLEDCINYLLTAAQKKVFQMMKDELSIYGVTPVQYGVLKCLWELDLTNPNEIAEKLVIDKSTISGILERMESNGLIQRSIDSNDRRYIRIELTKRSKLLEGLISETVQKVNKRALSDFTDEEAAEVRKQLKKIIAAN